MTTEKALREALAQAKIALLEANRNGFTHGFAALQCVNAALSLPETQGEPVGENLETLPPEVHEAINAYAMYYAEHHELGMSIRKDMQYIASVALRFAPPSQPAQGGRLVPVEPTPEMWDAAWNSIVLPYRAKLSMHEIKTLFDLFHKAMLAAAPAASEADDTIGSLERECSDLANQTIRQRALIEDLAAMCRRMSYALKRQGTNDTTVRQCVELLKKHDLGGSVIRENAPAAPTNGEGA